MSKKNKNIVNENEIKKAEHEDEKSFEEVIEEMFGKDDENNETDEETEIIKSDDEKTFDEIMNEILGEDDKNRKTDKEEFEEKIQEVSTPCTAVEAKNWTSEFGNSQEYTFSDNAKIWLSNYYDIFDTEFDSCYRESVLLQTSHHLDVAGSFNTKKLVIRKNPFHDKFGQVEFDSKQKTDSLIIENAGVFGEFDAAVVSIHDSSYVDIYLDITDKSKCTYLLIDTRFDRVRGKINMSHNFYAQLNANNLDLLIEINKNRMIKILVDDKPIEEYYKDYRFEGNINWKYSYIIDMLSDMNIDL